VNNDYDAIGRTYAAARRPDPSIAAAIAAAVGTCARVANIGAGTGSYESPQTIVAVEPSRVMIEQRPLGSAPVAQATAERLPLRDDCVDAAMALMTVHHWKDLAAGIAEMKRIATERLVVFTWDADCTQHYWLLREYFPAAAEIDHAYAIPIDRLTELLGNSTVVDHVPVPHDCADGFGAAYWRRPEGYLDPTVRAGMSFFARFETAELEPGLVALAADLESGRWHERHGDLLELDALDLGYCVLTAEL
jgi:hypothetical protein